MNLDFMSKMDLSSMLKQLESVNQQPDLNMVNPSFSQYDKEAKEIARINASNEDKSGSDDMESKEKEEKLEFIHPINDTDPWVRHDPTVGQTVLVKKYEPQNVDSSPNEKTGDPPGANEYDDITRSDGIFHPVIKINTHNINFQDIIYMKIYYTGFVPTIDITINDRNNVLKKIDTPGLNNIITVVMLPETEGIYKSISLDFYISSCDTSNPERIFYGGTYKFPPFTETKNTKQIKYPGCPNVMGRIGTNKEKGEDTVSCNPPPQIFPNTWEYLHEIAKYTGLGFSSTHQCREIQDRLPRRLQNLTYQEFIEKQILMSGIDENSMFDVWVDLYRYIVMVNVSWVLKQDINYKQLSIKAVTGKNTTDNTLFKARTKEVYRVLSNFNKMREPSNLEFYENKFTQTVNNDIKFDGIHTDVPVFQVRGGSVNNTGNTNLMNTSGVLAVEASVDGTHLQEYRNDTLYRNTVQVDPYNTNYQKMIRKRYFDLKRSKYYELELARPNFGLQRGTLVGISYMTRDVSVKQKIIDGGSAVFGGDENSIKPDPFKFDDENDNKTERDLIMNEDTQVFDPSKCGLYYIDGMTFEYSYQANHIIQKLLLIKKGTISNLQNNNTAPKFRPEELGKKDEASNDNSNNTNNSSTNGTNRNNQNNQEEIAPLGLVEIERYPYMYQEIKPDNGNDGNSLLDSVKDKLNNFKIF